MKMDKNDNKYKFDFWGKMENDPIFSQFVQDVVKKIVVTIIAFIGSFFVIEKVVIPIYESMRMKKEDVVKEVSNNWAYYLYETPSEEYENYITFRKDVAKYIEKEDEFERLEKAPANTISFGEVYYKMGLELFGYRIKIIEDVRLTAKQHNRQDLIKEIGELGIEMRAWKDSFTDCFLCMKSFAEEKDIQRRAEKFREKYSDNNDTVDTVYVEKNKFDIEDQQFIFDGQKLMRMAVELIQLYHSDEYYKMEKRYYEIVNEYLQMVKTLLMQEKWRSWTTIKP